VQCIGSIPHDVIHPHIVLTSSHCFVTYQRFCVTKNVKNKLTRGTIIPSSSSQLSQRHAVNSAENVVDEYPIHTTNELKTCQKSKEEQSVH
jgi:hypothetical protein